MNRTVSNSKCDVLRRLFRGSGARTIFAGLALTSFFLPGCTSPVFYTDNPVLIYLPGAGWRSDKLPGFTNPHERLNQIVEKGEKGKKAPVEEKNILLVQLSKEYETSRSPHMRRAALEAIGRISTNYSNPAAEKIFHEGLEDDDMNLNLSACRALALYCTEGDAAKNNKRERELAVSLLSGRYRELPYSLEAGSEADNSRRKDVRVEILHALAHFKPEDSSELFPALEYGLTGEKLDDGALETASCDALGKITGKRYGLDGEAWLAYLAYERGETSTAPKEKSLLTRAPRIEDATGIVK